MIPFLNLKKLNQPFETAFQQKMKQLFDSGWYILGNEFKTFEVYFANFSGAKHCIETIIHYPIPPHKQKAFSNLNHLIFPITEKIHNEVLVIPIDSSLTNDEIDQIIQTLNQY